MTTESKTRNVFILILKPVSEDQRLNMTVSGTKKLCGQFIQVEMYSSAWQRDSRMDIFDVQSRHELKGLNILCCVFLYFASSLLG